MNRQKRERERARTAVESGEPRTVEQPPKRQEQEQMKGRQSDGEPQKPAPQRQPGRLPLPD